MGMRYERRSVDVVITTAESLKVAAEKFSQIALEMQQHGLLEALFPWTQHQWNCLDVVVSLAGRCQNVLPSQILAKQQGRPSQYEMIQKRSRRDVAARKARQSQSGANAEPKRPRGRPRTKSV